MIIDIHTHCYPDEVASWSVSVRSKKFGITPVTDGTVDGLKASMARSEVDISVLHPIALKPEQTVKMNRWSATVQDKKIIAFGTIHPDLPNWRQEIKWLADNGFKGVKFHADCQGYYVDDPHMLNIYRAVIDASLIILFHSGVDRAFTHPFMCTPQRLARVLDTFPEATIIAAHLGGYRYWDDARRYLLGKDIYLDTAYSIHELGLEESEQFIKSHGADKILFGTDSPWRDQRDDIALIRSFNLSIEDINGILGGNAKKLLGL
ncbi:MAG TPA: amidohydrolase family protein [Clostridiales bacterium]|jgi:predicted TIM-barrel fold metal-dependent hydrolase|nr:amidohydrolase family protein [Clostridiales bacterium]